ALSVQEGYERSAHLQEADLVIVNTCCVRESAENKILGKIGELKKLKEQKPGLLIAVTGCMVQQPEALERLQKRASHVDIWTGTYNLHNFSAILQQIGTSGKTALVCDQPDDSAVELFLPEQGKLQADVNIMYGCNNFCSYCIVPYVRGRERSRRPEDIIQEIGILVENGCREVTLLGQNVNSYGLEFLPAYDFADLLQEIAQISRLWRVRFMTSHPKDLSDKLIATIAAGSNLCEHIHLPVQAGSNEILHKMNRRYTREYYLSSLGKIHQQIPGVSITTDIIVGFPGESEDDFLLTLDLVKQSNFSQAFTFMYSKRSGTPAAEMPDQIPLHIKKRRLQELMNLQKEKSLEWRQNMLSKSYQILVEGPSKTNPQRLTGRTRSNELVVFTGDSSLIGTMTNVRITEAGPWTLVGEII
ncbi:MAG TPA: tRNA (N6-isopentenyl adenosine(37)-C2)-methylthiotransferase MiaB, partial [Desulfitobacteriaceae bacterium]|nr:tRNA (N6-isopentenyl adenosine(37)-C2)-methylthiotransferase MiaB [Desulfitobacteriaceae bacterium]